MRRGRMSVFSVLHDIQNTLVTRFPGDAARLHPYLCTESSASWTEERERLLSQVRALRQGVESFKRSWTERTPTDDADAVEQKKTVLLRIMVDWQVPSPPINSRLTDSAGAQTNNPSYPSHPSSPPSSPAPAHRGRRPHSSSTRH